MRLVCQTKYSTKIWCFGRSGFPVSGANQSLVLWARILYLWSVMAEGHNRVNICCLPGWIQTEENAD